MNYDEQSVLDATYLNGMFNERERILALLEKRTAVVDGDLMLAEYWSVLVALIKGDDK